MPMSVPPSEGVCVCVVLEIETESERACGMCGAWCLRVTARGVWGGWCLRVTPETLDDFSSDSDASVCAGARQPLDAEPEAGYP